MADSWHSFPQMPRRVDKGRPGPGARGAGPPAG